MTRNETTQQRAVLGPAAGTLTGGGDSLPVAGSFEGETAAALTAGGANGGPGAMKGR